jgi:hypothetical protein
MSTGLSSKMEIAKAFKELISTRGNEAKIRLPINAQPDKSEQSP